MFTNKEQKVIILTGTNGWIIRQ